MHPEHLKTFDYLGVRQYFLTFCTYHRARLFTDPARVGLVSTQISRASQEEGFSVIAYCFMPDHIHLLVEGTSDVSDCLRFIARAKQYAGFYYKRVFKDRLWQRFGYEHVLRDEEAAISVARYILENPVRAGIARTVQEYPFSGSSVYSIEQLRDAVQLRDHWYRRAA